MTRFNLSAFAVRERALTLFLIIAIAAAGAFAFVRLGRAEDPSFGIKTMTVSFVWPGATAEDMQTQVADRMERRVQELEWLDYVETASRPGLLTMRIQLRDDIAHDAIGEQFYQIRKKLTDEAANLPQGVLGPFLNDEYGDVYFALYALEARGMPHRELVREAERLRAIYSALPGVQQVDLIGEQAQRIYVEFSRERLATLGVTPQQVFAALRGQNVITPSGAIDTNAAQVAVRVGDGFDTVESVRAVPLVANGRTLTIGDVGTVRRGFEDPPRYLVRHDGEPAIELGVVMRPNYNGLTLGDSVREATQELQAELPLGLTLTPVVDQAHNIAHAVDEFMIKFVVALAVVLLVSFLSLGWRVGVVVAAAVPLTLAAVFVIMLATGRDFDRITLGALILSLGLLVDDAIIAIEMMVVKMEEGLSRIEAASFAWTSTAFPMLTGTLVTIIGFLPVGLARSTAGEYAGNIFWIVGFALLTSWVVAVWFTPYLGVKLLPNIAPAPGGHAAIYDRPIYARLRRLVDWCVERRRVVVAATLGALVVAGLGLGLVQKQFFPNSERPEVLIEIYMPQGSAIAATQREVEAIETVLLAQPETKGLTSYIGAGAPRFFLSLNPELPNPAFAKIVVMTEGPRARNALRRRMQQMFDEGAFPAARARATQLVFGPPVPFPVRFRVMGPDANEVRRIADQVREVVAANPNARNAHLEWRDRAPAAALTFDAQRLNQIGLTREAAGLQLQALLSGAVATQARDGTRTVDVVVRATEADRGALGALEGLTLFTNDGRAVPLAQVATITPVSEDPLLWRRNREVMIHVQADVTEGVQPPDVTGRINRELAALRAELPAGYRIETSGPVEESTKANSALFALFPLMFLLMLATIMIQVRSFSKMLLVFATGPLGLIGAVIALIVTHQPFGFNAILGLIGIGGILMRNTLILIDQIEQDMAHGLDPRTAAIESTVRRARPVVLTALAAVLAFVPLTLSAFWGQLAVVLIGGVSVGTVLTLLVLPAAYVMFLAPRRDSAPAPVVGALERPAKPVTT